jgi:HK97 family phage prohead protease
VTATDTRTVLIGYALLFNEIIDKGDGKLLMVRPTAFKNVMRGPTVSFLHNHDKTMIVGSTEHGLTLHVDSKGIGFKFYTPAGTLGAYTRHCVRTNWKEAMSAGFKSTKCEDHVVLGKTIRVITEAELFEISLVTRGANDHAFAVLVDDCAAWIPDLCQSLRMIEEMYHAHKAREQRRSGQMTVEAAADGVSQAMQGLLHALASKSSPSWTSSSFG